MEGASFGATREAGEPGRGGATLWYRWTAPFTGGVTFETCGSDFDTVLAAYSGSALRWLRRLASDDDACESQSRIRFAARAGVAYRIQLSGADGESGEFTLSWRGGRMPANDRFTAGATAVRPEGQRLRLERRGAHGRGRAGRIGLAVVPLAGAAHDADCVRDVPAREASTRR